MLPVGAAIGFASTFFVQFVLLLCRSGAFIKDLSLLGRELRNVIIIDNSTKAYLWHMENAIPIKSW